MSRIMNVAVVLTHTRMGDRPSREGLQRLEAGCRRLESGEADVLVVAGGLPGPDGRSLAEVYRDFLARERGMDTRRVLLETEGRDTAETLRHIPRLLARELPAAPRHIFLVSDARHLRRARRAIAVLPEWHPFGVSFIPSASSPGWLGGSREVWLDLYARVDPAWRSPLARFMRARRARLAANPARRMRLTERDARGEGRPGAIRKVVAAVPCLNEAAFVGPIVIALQQHVHEVIVVDDGSTDGTARVAEEAGATVIRHGGNLGYGRALRSCFDAAARIGADVLVTLDGDGQHDPEQVPDLVRPIVSGAADLVIGSRHLGTVTGIPPYRRVGIAVITALFNAGSKARVTDAQSGYRAFHSGVFRAIEIRESGMGASVEILVKARSMGFRFAEVPITCSYHASSSTLNPVRHGVGVALKVVEHRARAVFSKRFRHDPSSWGTS